MDGGGADNKVALAKVVRRMADGHGDAERAQMLDGRAVVHVAALDLETHAVQHLCQRLIETPPMPARCAHLPGTR